MSIKFKGYGSFVPNKPITNFDIENLVNTSDEWIKTRTGISQRYFAGSMKSSDMAYYASIAAIEDSEIDLNDINGIVVCTSTPDMTYPSTAAYLHNKLGFKSPIFAFDINAACSGFLYGLHLANALIRGNEIKNILLVGVDKLSDTIDFEQRSTAVLFGDGAGAVVISKSHDGFFDSNIYCDGSHTDKLYSNTSMKSDKIFMNGQEVYKYAVNKMTESCINILTKHNLVINDIGFFVPHQANIRIIESVAEKLGIKSENVAKTVSIHANTSAATIPLALDYYRKNGKLLSNELCLMTSVGAGFTWGSSIIKI